MTEVKIKKCNRSSDLRKYIYHFKGDNGTSVALKYQTHLCIIEKLRECHIFSHIRETVRKHRFLGAYVNNSQRKRLLCMQSPNACGFGVGCETSAAPMQK